MVDRPRPQSLYGGAVILLDEHLNAVSLRMYNESEQSTDYSVAVGAAGPPPNSPSLFFSQINSLVKPQSSPWSDFSKAVAAAVVAHTRKLAAALSKGS